MGPNAKALVGSADQGVERGGLDCRMSTTLSRALWKAILYEFGQISEVSLVSPFHRRYVVISNDVALSQAMDLRPLINGSCRECRKISVISLARRPLPFLKG